VRGSHSKILDTEHSLGRRGAHPRLGNHRRRWLHLGMPLWRPNMPKNYHRQGLAAWRFAAKISGKVLVVLTKENRRDGDEETVAPSAVPALPARIGENKPADSRKGIVW